ncbi:hypothetical protein D3C71_1686610 [compost metagenome]
MGAVDHNLEAGKAGTGRHTALAEFDIPTRRVIDSRHLADLARLNHSHWGIEQLFDHVLDFIRKLGALAGEELDAIVIMRIM